MNVFSCIHTRKRGYKNSITKILNLNICRTKEDQVTWKEARIHYVNSVEVVGSPEMWIT